MILRNFIGQEILLGARFFHLSKYGQKSLVDFEEIANSTIHFNGAEIEECVKEAMFIAYNENPDVKGISLKHLQDAIKPIVPLARTMPNQINFLREFGRTNRARAASRALNDEKIADEKAAKGATVVKTKSERAFDVFEDED